MIVDPGTYNYTADPESRNRFRSTACHNTVTVDAGEQNRFYETYLFEMENDAVTKYLKWDIGNGSYIFEGEHYGYKRYSLPVVHRREIKFYENKNILEITDKFEGGGEHNFEWDFILPPDLDAKLKIESNELQFHEKPAFYSPEYGIKIQTKKLVSTMKAVVPVEFRFSIGIENNANT